MPASTPFINTDENLWSGKAKPPPPRITLNLKKKKEQNSGLLELKTWVSNLHAPSIKLGLLNAVAVC